jgi:hypothetical protein
MKPHVRAAVAALALSHNGNRKVSSVFAYGQGGYVNVEVSISNGRVSGYDYSNRCHFDGNLPNLYHYGEGGT